MIRHSNIRYTLYFVGVAWHTLALLFLLRGGVSARLRDLAERTTPRPALQALLYYPLFSLAYLALSLPLSFYSGYLEPRQFGLSTQTLSGWATDVAKEWSISAAIGAPVLAVFFWTLRRSPRRWWLGCWLLSIPFLICMLLLGPILIDPLFNKFQPLRNVELRDRILALAHQAGIEHGRVFEVDASRRTKQVNAYVTGIGGSARIVLWDTLLQRLNEDEVLFVMAHEMGHYAEGHVLLGLALSMLGTGGTLLILDQGMRRLLARTGDSWGLRGKDDLASLPAWMLLGLVLSFLGTPATCAVSRVMEERADAYALRLTHNGRIAASSFIKLSELNLSNPDPPAFIEFWMFSHPPLRKRIQRALQAGPD